MNTNTRTRIKTSTNRLKRWLIAIACLVVLVVPVGGTTQRTSAAPAAADTSLGVQAFLDAQPGVLKTYQENGQSAATIIEVNSLFYGISPYLHLALLETTSALLSDPNPPPDALRHPYGPAGPDGFAAQIEWASRELRAGYGPYDKPPTLNFADGEQLTLTLDQAPEGVAVQRFLAPGHTLSEWRTLVDRFGQVFQDYFNNELPELAPAAPAGLPLEAPTTGFLQAPWPMGMKVIHLAYFDHAYPTVDSGGDGNEVVVTYAGTAHVQYNTHDGHDYVFPDNPVGSPILAAAPGLAYARTARGNGIVILHAGGYETVYWHLNSFAPKFRRIVDSAQGVWVETGEVLGTSGKTGFRSGTPHLHFEVRHHGRQVDPYGWHGEGDDPCLRYAACEDHGWLWHRDLYGLYDFTPPDHVLDDGTLNNVQVPEPDMQPDTTPPFGTLSVNPPDDLLFAAHFDGHVLQTRGAGFPTVERQHDDDASTLPVFDSGRYGQSVALPTGTTLTYPISDNLSLDRGSISLWVRTPLDMNVDVDVNGTGTGADESGSRRYLFAASANPNWSEAGYPGTLALRRDVPAGGTTPQWNFWTVSQDGSAGSHELTAPDTLTPGWHHMAVTWDRARGSKTLAIDGVTVAATDGVTLPLDVGATLHLGGFPYGSGSTSGNIALDDLAFYRTALSSEAIVQLAETDQPLATSTTVLTDTALLLDTNAQDTGGTIVGVQLGRDGEMGDPQPYYDSFRWTLPPVEGEHDVTVRYFDRASNRRVVSHTVTLHLPPQGSARVYASDDVGATLAITATDLHPPVEMQISQSLEVAALEQAEWEPLQTYAFRVWQQEPPSLADADGDTAAPRVFYVRFRDAEGMTTDVLPVPVAATQPRVYVPLVLFGAGGGSR